MSDAVGHAFRRLLPRGTREAIRSPELESPTRHDGAPSAPVLVPGHFILHLTF